MEPTQDELDSDEQYEKDMAKLTRLEAFADMVIAMTEPITEDIRPDEFITDTRARHTLHSMATLAKSGSVLVARVPSGDTNPEDAT